MSYSEAFRPYIDSATNTSTSKTVLVTGASSATVLGCSEVLVKCYGYPMSIKLGKATDTVTDTTGIYMAVGDEIRLQTSKDATHLLAIRIGANSATMNITLGSGE